MKDIFLQLTSKDAILYVYKKTIFEINNILKKYSSNIMKKIIDNILQKQTYMFCY